MIILPGDRDFYSAVEYLDRHVSDRLESLATAAQQELQMQYTTGQKEPRVAHHQAEQPRDPRHAWIIGKLNHEPDDVDLGLHPKSWTVLSWKIPVMNGGPGYGVCDEEIEVFRSADRICAQAGGRWHAGWRGVSQGKDQRGDLL